MLFLREKSKKQKTVNLGKMCLLYTNNNYTVQQEYCRQFFLSSFRPISNQKKKRNDTASCSQVVLLRMRERKTVKIKVGLNIL